MYRILKYIFVVVTLVNALAIITASIKIMNGNYDFIKEAIISISCLVILLINLYIKIAEQKDE